VTDKHPLTDEICRQIADTIDRPFTVAEMDNMRVAYDLAVNKAVDEFGYALYVLSQNYGDILDKQDISDLVREFQEAMWGTTTLETPKDKLKCLAEVRWITCVSLIKGVTKEQLLEAFNQLEDN
tara:strand:- start:307 stop:678 length:372 start_codon:yes stop_codon:yes gene_type:complete